MKQIIVMVAIVVLGIFIAGLVNQFGLSAETLTTAANSKIATVSTEIPE